MSQIKNEIETLFKQMLEDVRLLIEQKEEILINDLKDYNMKICLLCPGGEQVYGDAANAIRMSLEEMGHTIDDDADVRCIPHHLASFLYVYIIFEVWWDLQLSLLGEDPTLKIDNRQN